MTTAEATAETTLAAESQTALPALPATRLLIDEEPLLVLPRLAAAIGLNAAIVLQQVRYWLGDKRRPQVRDGERWVYNTYAQWQEQFPFWSRATIKKTFRELEERGLLRASQRYNRAPTDRTKWYTIDFPRLLALDAALGTTANIPPREQLHLLEGRDRALGRDQIDPFPRGQLQPLEGIETHPSNQRLPTEITTEITQQQHAAPSPAAASPRQSDDGVVVVVHPPELVRLLTERGITARVARSLIADHAATMVARQVAHYDHERAADPADPRLTPGRLRRRIEGDWSPPPDFMPATERACEAATGARRRAVARAAQEGEDERRRQEQAALVAAVGATAEEQAAWHILVNSPTPLPMIFRTALFRAPGEGHAPVIVLRTAEGYGRAVGDVYARERRELERRLRERFPTYARAALVDGVGARYATYDECAADIAAGASANVVGMVRSAAPDHAKASR